MKINFRFLALLLILPVLIMFTSCEEDEEIEDGTVTVKVTGITEDLDSNSDGQNILAAVFPKNTDPGSGGLALAGQRADCTAAGNYTLLLYKMATPTTLSSEIWEGDGGEEYDLYIYIDGNTNDVPDDAGIDWQLKIWPITFEVDGDYSITVAYPADFTVAD